MSMSGVPPFGGWVDEVFFIRSGIENIRFEFLVIQIAVSLLTFLYMLRAFNQIFGGFNPVLFGEISERYHELKGTAAAKSLVLIVLMILVVCIGVAPQLFVLFITRMGNVAFP
jgi:formate hydrogenlyase subunit 3/multisubunit Na+/H+ antiporter MnhD subunit